jgi:predicted metal-dependent phosphoesterase TrpH
MGDAMNGQRWDLHVHSTHSDGLFSPQDLAGMAVAAGLAGLALTDHDTISGVADMKAAGAALGLEVVSGVEISADFDPGTLHLVGLFVDPAHPVLSVRLAKMQAVRLQRNHRIVGQLAEAGLPITYAEVAAEAKDGQLGRPHFAAVLIRKGLVGSMDEAFDRWLGKGRPGYVEREKLSPEAAVGMIREAGGVAVLAHPIQLRLEEEALVSMVARLASAGLQGLEAWHSDHDGAQVAQYQDLAKRYGLVCSGGSDFHGFADKPVRLGQPSVGAEAMAQLRSLATA